MDLTVQSAKEKFKTLDELVEMVGDFKKRGCRVVFTNGCFDLIHSAHIELLEKAKDLGDYLIVGLSTDDSIKRTKGTLRPIISETDRVQVISGIYCIDYVTLYNEDTPSEMIVQLKPDIHVKGYDYNPDDALNMPEAEVVRSYGGEVKIIETIKKFSTSEIISLIREGKY